MKVRGQRAFRRRRAEPGVGRRRSPVAALVAALALIVQLFAAPYHQAQSQPIEGAQALKLAATAAELKATFGEAAALCIQSDDHGKPAGSHDCDDRCPLCRLGAQAAALVAPEPPSLPARLDQAIFSRGAAPPTVARLAAQTHPHQARAPPFAV